MKKERLTPQKKIVLELLKESKDHPSADEIFERAGGRLPGLSKSTVYRIIKDLKDKGSITEIPHTSSRYDGDTSSHAHFICDECGKIFDIFEDVCKECGIIKSTKTKVGQITNYQIYFHGKCKTCLNR